jgi:hypothetical protein
MSTKLDKRTKEYKENVTAEVSSIEEDLTALEINKLSDEELEKSFEAVLEDEELSELDTLKLMCTDMSISFTDTDSLDTIKSKINDKLKPKDVVNTPKINQESKASLRKKALLMKRVKITNVHPKQQDLKGAIFTFLNSNTGDIRYFVPQGKHCGEFGVYIPKCILNLVERKQYQTFEEVKNENGISTKKSTLVKQFIVTYLPDITPKELAELKRQQSIRLI